MTLHDQNPHDDQTRREFEHALRRRDYASIDEVASSLGLQDLADGARATAHPDGTGEMLRPLPNRS